LLVKVIARRRVPKGAKSTDPSNCATTFKLRASFGWQSLSHDGLGRSMKTGSKA